MAFQMARCAALLKFLFVMSVGLCVALDALADVEPANRLLDEQRGLRRAERLDDEALPTSPAVPAPALDADPAAVSEGGPTLHEPRIEVEANGLLSDRELAAVIEAFRGLDIGQRRIELLLRQLDARLVSAGWVTSRAQLTSIDWRYALITIALVPGRVERIAAGDVPAASLAQVLPLRVGDVLAIEALEQGVQQINRLRMYEATVQIKPGAALGGSLLDIQLERTRPWRASIGVDNQGQRSTGSGRLRVQGRLEDLLGRFDELQLAYLRSERSEALLASFALPNGYNTWSITLTGSRSKSSLLGLDYTSRAVTTAFGWHRVLELSHAGQDAVDLTLTRARSDRVLEGHHLSRERSTVLRAAWIGVRRGASYQYYVEPAISQGLAIMDAIEDADGLPREHVHRQFTKLAASAGLVIRMPGRLQYAAQVTAQCAHVSIIGSEQITLGGLASVRGFEESAVSGDTGYLLRQELRLPEAPQIGPLRPSLFVHLDAGATWLTGGKRNSLSSMGVGGRATGGGLTWEGVLSFPLRYAEDMSRHTWRAHVQLTYEF
jgi:hemolysin activation/secretion protein